jgi:hypothetical protein
MTTPIEFGTLEYVEARSGWTHEALHFTPWLADNLDRLSKAVGIPLLKEDTEVGVGRYAADILARDPEGRAVLIENQLEVSDHRHLGQILTYLTGLKAELIIWVAPEFREEHLSAILWLNENTKEPFAFFAVRLRVVQIGDSPLAPLFEVIARPNNWDRQIQQIAQASGEVSERVEFQRTFWTHFRNQYPDSLNDALGGGGSSLWRKISDTDFVVARWLAGNGVGVFVRGGRGLATEAVVERLRPHEEFLQDRLGIGLTNRAYPLLKRLDIDMTKEANWPEAAAWLNQTTETYAAILAGVLAPRRGE